MHSIALLKPALTFTYIRGYPAILPVFILQHDNLLPPNYLKRNKGHGLGAMHLNDLVKSNRLQLQ